MYADDLGEEPTPKQGLQKLAGRIWMVVPLVFLPLIMLYVFGFSAKTTEEYACALRLAEQDRQVAALIGEPLKPGFFAWTSYFESGGGQRQGRFSTALSGPRGRGRLIVEFYRTRIGSSLGLWLRTEGGEIEVYSGEYPCR